MTIVIQGINPAWDINSRLMFKLFLKKLYVRIQIFANGNIFIR
jgi:hypothetical protein